MKNKNIPYYLGLDIGTDSVGYAVTDETYKLLRFKGKSMWGSGLFDPATPCQERRAFRTARRRLDRRQQRIRLLQEFFAKPISSVDPKFFVRIRESALYACDRTDKKDTQSLFNDASFKDADFYGKYPTIHHLICELMDNPEPHDVRLVYIACAWLMAHRGHFLSEISLENLTALANPTRIYNELMEMLNAPCENEDGEIVEWDPAWECDAKSFSEILVRNQSLSRKRDAFIDLLFAGKKPKSGDTRYGRCEMISLLCGGDVQLKSLFRNEAYEDLGKIGFTMKEDKIEELLLELGDDAGLIRKAKELYDWSILQNLLDGESLISRAKVAVYDQHRKDLTFLKKFLKKHDGEFDPKAKSGLTGYNSVFHADRDDNYTAFVYNGKTGKKATKIVFCEWLRKGLAAAEPRLSISDDERPGWNDMMDRLSRNEFLPKQIDGDNRVIPHQLYQVELRKILENAAGYLPFLNEADEYGTVSMKIDKMFGFRVPYFVGPLVEKDALGGRGKFAWMVRKSEGEILPWTFADKVDLEKSEEAFIRKMTNRCSYLPEEDVLPMESLLYKEFMLLNEINPIRIGGAPLPPDVKQRLIDSLFKAKRKPTRNGLVDWLVSERLMNKGDELTGLDESIKSNLSSFHDFKKWLEGGALSAVDVEDIILRSTCTEDSHRFGLWLKAKFGNRLPDADRKKIARLKYTEFGRLSARFLDGVVFEDQQTGERGTVMHFLRERGEVLMELLSERYTLRDKIDEINRSFRASHPQTLEERLKDLYVSTAVKRQIYRALDIVKTVTKVMGHAPEKIFVEMARGGTPDQKGKRTVSRFDQLHELYKTIRDEDAKTVSAELAKMDENNQNRLQSDALFLWTLQYGKCAYCGKPLAVEDLKSHANIDHILPQSIIKDDSVLNNKVLCCSACNGRKSDVYPVPMDMRQEDFWHHLHRVGLMTGEKLRRLARIEPLTDSEKEGFIARQLVETRQTTKAILTILGEMFEKDGTRIVAVKAGNVSDFRQTFEFVKCRSINDLHHAKDAYLNIAVGNVFDEKFSRQWFRVGGGEPYSMKTSTLFGPHPFSRGGKPVWSGAESLERIRTTLARNDIHLTKFAFRAKGGFFDQMPKSSADGGAIPRKSGLDCSRYGGYAMPTGTGFVPVAYSEGKKRDIMLLSINLLDYEKIILGTESEALKMVEISLKNILKKNVAATGFPLSRNLLKINTVLELDGKRFVLAGKTGANLLVRSLVSAVLPAEEERDRKSVV